MTALWRNYLTAAALHGCLLLVVLSASTCFGATLTRAPLFYPGGQFRLGNSAWGDYDNDGFPDLMASGWVLHNESGTSFSLASTAISNAIWGDYNNDGNLDLYGFGGRRLMENNGAGALGLTVVGTNDGKIPTVNPHLTLGAAWVDLNNDGYLDIYSGGYNGLADSIMTYNTGTQEFDITWSQAGWNARGVTAADFDRDGDQDVYVSNYNQQANILWQNDGFGVMTNVAVARNVDGDNPPVAPSGNPYGHTIGSAWGDMDNDGWLDLFVGNFNHHDGRWSDEAKFMRNPGGPGPFVQMAELDGADWQESYAAPALGDYDNDGDLDLYFTAVYGGDAPRLYRNDGNWNFTNVTAAAGLAGIENTFQGAWADVDNDGDLDLATGGYLHINDASSNGNHWLKIHLTGDGTMVNSSAIGAQVIVRDDIGNILGTRQVEGATGQGNQNDLTLHYGLGSYAGLVDFEILWPDGTLRTITDITTDQLVDAMLAFDVLGDLNSDGFVGGADLDIVIGHWGQSVTPGDLLLGDPSGDGFVGGGDLDFVQANWGNGVPLVVAAASSVPEPGSLALLTLGGLVLLMGMWPRKTSIILDSPSPG
jgi:hypothetical protein